MISFTINDKEIQVEEDTTILEAAISVGIEIPTLCYHKELTSFGGCRLCLVEIVLGNKSILVASCLYKATNGLVVKTDTERVKKARGIVFEILMARCPDVEFIKKLGAKWGVTGSRIKLKKTGDCFLCGLCVRACSEISQRNAINFAFRGRARTVRPAFNRTSERCIGCGACAHLCPAETIKIESVE